MHWNKIKWLSALLVWYTAGLMWVYAFDISGMMGYYSLDVISSLKSEANVVVYYNICSNYII